MSNRYLILGANTGHSRHFARENGLKPTNSTVVVNPQQLKGYTETTLFVLDGWDTHQYSPSMIEVFKMEMYWFKKRNVIRMMRDDELISDKSRVLLWGN